MLIFANFIWQWCWVWVLLTGLLGFFGLYKLPSSPISSKKINNNKLFFLSTSASIGLGSILVVMNGINKYGAGILIWIWIGSFIGRYVKFWELYFSIINKNNYDLNGPISYIGSMAPYLKWIFIIFQCLYSIEIFQWNYLNNFLINTTQYFNLPINSYGISIVLIFLLLNNRRQWFITINNNLMKLFFCSYIVFFLLIYMKNYNKIFPIINAIFSLPNIFQWNVFAEGIKIVVYTNDIGLGYEGLLENYNQESFKEIWEIKNYCLSIINNNWLDLLVCTISGLIILMVPMNYKPLSDVFFKILIQNLGPWGLILGSFLIFSLCFSTVSTLYQYSQLIISHYKIVNKTLWGIMVGLLLLLCQNFNFYNIFELITTLGAFIMIINTTIIFIKIFYYLKLHIKSK